MTDERRRDSGKFPKLPEIVLEFEETGMWINVSRRVLWVTHDEARALYAKLHQLFGDR
jgi:hypothetical protein